MGAERIHRLGHVSRARLDLVRFIEHDAMPYVRVHDGLLLQLGAQKIVLHPLGRVHRQVHPALNHFALVLTLALASARGRGQLLGNGRGDEHRVVATAATWRRRRRRRLLLLLLQLLALNVFRLSLPLGAQRCRATVLRLRHLAQVLGLEVLRVRAAARRRRGDAHVLEVLLAEQEQSLRGGFADDLRVLGQGCHLDHRGLGTRRLFAAACGGAVVLRGLRWRLVELHHFHLAIGCATPRAARGVAVAIVIAGCTAPRRGGDCGFEVIVRVLHNYHFGLFLLFFFLRLPILLLVVTLARSPCCRSGSACLAAALVASLGRRGLTRRSRCFA
mmetsp:Transcript_13524/g.49202  ORF Transcript_13524/g.49202 Transcript_13524/m.49202 type:complete len:331 (+) Transcript_13524:1575-2567(+)